VVEETLGCPECSTFSGELCLGIEQPPVKVHYPNGICFSVAQPAKNQFVIPYTATCQFGEPRERRASEEF